MAENTFILIFTILFGLVVSASLGLFVWCYFVQPYWQSDSNSNESSKAARRLLFFCALAYILCAVLLLISFIVFLNAGWNAAETVTFLMGAFYLISLLLMVYVWIQRLETTFINSAYELSPRFLKGLKYTFLAVIILGVLATVLFIANGGGEEENALAFITIAIIAIFIILFIGLLITLLYSFISKLNQLRKVAENRLNKANDAGDYDLESMAVIQKLVKLQTKLTIAAILAIVSSLFAIPLTIVFDQEFELLPYAFDVMIGFFCVHCTIKTHNVYYETLCKCCIFGCDLCCNTTQLDTQMNNHIAVHSKSNAQTGDGSSGMGTSAIIVTQTPYTQDQQQNNHHTVAPSDNISTDNQRREITNDPSNTQTND